MAAAWHTGAQRSGLPALTAGTRSSCAQRCSTTLAAGARVTLLSAPAGSGKTSLLRSWSAEPDVEERVAWVTVGRRERDPQRFWLALLDALRATRPGSRVVGALTAGREFDAGNLVERLLEDLSGLDEPLWLVLDDLHELDDPASLDQLETLVTEAPPELRFVLAARHDPRLGLHRLRLEGQLPELRAADLRFTAEEAAQLFETAGVEVSSAGTRRSSWRGPRVGQQASGWQRCRSPVTPIPSALPRTSRAVSERSPSTCSRRSSSASLRRCEDCCCARRSWSRSPGRWPTG